jgi:pyruvate kinase
MGFPPNKTKIICTIGAASESTQIMEKMILAGTNGVMLCGESALGKYLVESVEMLVKIAAAIGPHRPSHQVRELLKSMAQKGGAKHPETNNRVEILELRKQRSEISEL